MSFSIIYIVLLCFFFFQAEDGIRDSSVTGVQTCALPILVVDALDVVGMPEREDGESVNDYVNRDSWGPNTRANLLNAEEAAERFDQVGATAAVHSARQHHDNPAPPDSKPLKP